MINWKIRVSTKEETIALGKLLGTLLVPKMIITLNGNLGAGKTTFTSGVAQGLRINEKVLSPSFNIMRCYFKGTIPLYHIDAYRLEDGINSEIGLEEYIEGEGIAIIEWPQYIHQFIPREKLQIDITVLENEVREFNFVAHGGQYDNLLLRLKEEKR